MLEESASKLGTFAPSPLGFARRVFSRRTDGRELLRYDTSGMRPKALEWAFTIAALFGVVPAVVMADHQADHRFTVEGFVCEGEGKGSANVDVMVKDTRVSYGQIVKTDGDGYYKATFHLHNDNLGDPLLIEAKGQQKEEKVQFDPKDLETERKIQVNFGSGCVHDVSAPPGWFYAGLGAGGVAIVGLIGAKMYRSWRKQGQKRGKSQGKRKK